MAKKSKSGDKKKKKGPKGKKAREKAKLDRQWGEEAFDTGRAFQKGRYSRMRNASDLKKKKKKQQEHDPNDDDEQVMMEATKKLEHGDSSGDSGGDSSEVEDETVELCGGAYAKLLKTIQTHKDNTKRDNQDSEDDSFAESDDEEMEESNKEEAMQEVLSEDDSSDDESVKGEATNENGKMELFDPFGDRFTRQAEPLPEDEEKRENVIRNWQETLKVPLPHVDPMLELQVSKQLLQEMQLADAALSDKETWKKLANRSFDCNREVLKRSWKNQNGNRKSNFTNLQRVLYPFLTRYADCLITNKPSSQVTNMTILHIANHVLTSRGRIQRLNRKLRAEQDNNNDDTSSDIRDQGYTRPTVLVMLPTRGTCQKFVQQLLQLIGGDDTVPKEYLDRFDKEYGLIPQDDEDDGQDPVRAHNTSEALKRRRKRVLEEKGAAWLELFGDDANDDDDFKIGIALNAKGVDSNKKEKANDKEAAAGNRVNVKLYTDFYSSDIIVCSPLGLKMATTSSEGGEGDADFLSSIEICLLDRSDVLMMQNWDHVNAVLDRVNQLPQNNNETDFSRVRNYLLANQACHWRQMIVITEVADPTILSTFKRFAKSKSGIFKTRRRILDDEGSIAKVIVPIQQVFQRVPVQSLSSLGDDRMKYLTQKVLPPILQRRQKRTLIYIPSYFDFVLLRNYLLKKEFDFVTINEYSRVSETSRGRARFLQGRKPLMLYTGRAHFFLRHKIKGIRNLIFFGLPEHPEFYADMVNVINEGSENFSGDGDEAEDTNNGSIALFTRYDAHALERIVGTKQSSRMLKGEKPTFLFFS
ncbi:Digestive organ expansion factor homolog [Seminavis robusta]|uniref:Digestive organ expansion factor homolog n=1 Tax=Seminavis robusta TaxID=568900 RepID=A0A9N8D8J1_9STRA|nr:Digestive organ expansion factor homolog [Seminavis robusta]|eukprot:Sro37_g023250.1 Digestive organ expansion factor homolog (811) ;mRNA; f:85237-87669